MLINKGIIMQVRVTVKYNASTVDQVYDVIGTWVTDAVNNGWVDSTKSISKTDATAVDGVITLVRTFNYQKALDTYLSKLDALDPSIKPISIDQEVVA
jgi:hypothetical protein